jgi:predicted metal-binding membrane protein
MSLVWVAGIAFYVACEKLLPLDQRLSRAAGVVLIVAGTIVLARAT